MSKDAAFLALLDKLEARRGTWLSGIKDRSRSIAPEDTHAMKMFVAKLQELDDIIAIV